MRIKSLIISVLGIAVAGASVFVAKQHLLDQSVIAVSNESPGTVEVLVVRSEIAFGDPVGAEHLSFQSWPTDAVPEGVFLERSEVLPSAGEEPRRARAKLYEGELLLKAKLSDFGEKVTIVQKLGKNTRAMAIKVDAATAVGGFVTPGDHVDILLTQGGRADLRAVTVLQNIRVIGVDQQSAEDQDTPTLARTITVEVTPIDGQKLALAQRAGTLSLTLRTLDGVEDEPMAMIRLNDLLQDEGPVPEQAPKPSVKVRRGAQIEIVNVN